MKLSNDFFMTRRHLPKDESTLSSKLLVKSGMILKNSSGIYTYTPMGLRLISNIQKIIREELNSVNANEVLMPTMTFVDEINEDSSDFSVESRKNKTFLLSSSSIESFINLAKYRVKSYKDLHFTLYQIASKFRDEIKNDHGLVHKNEFLLLEGYSFDADESGLDVSYDKMYLAFKKIFNRLCLNVEVVRSNEELLSEEFQIITNYGDNEIVKCSNCTYSSILEDAVCNNKEKNNETKERKIKLVSNSDKEFNNIFRIKSIICKIDGINKLFLLKYSDELNISKIKNIFKTNNIEIIDDSKYEGPIGTTYEIIADSRIKNMKNFICDSNKKGKYYINVNYGRDFKINRFEDIIVFNDTCLCPKCNSKCNIINGVEVGQISILDKKKIDKYDLKYTNELNLKESVYMGSYRLGIDRCINAIVEENHDEKGIIWPINIAPYKVSIIVSNINDENLRKYSNNLYNKLQSYQIETILDDRKTSIGVKLNDMDLIGIPICIIVGESLENGEVEVKFRTNKEKIKVKTNEIINFIEENIYNSQKY